MAGIMLDLALLVLIYVVLRHISPPDKIVLAVLYVAAGVFVGIAIWHFFGKAIPEKSLAQGIRAVITVGQATLFVLKGLVDWPKKQVNE